MSSVRLVYDAEGDILDIDFRLTGERPRRGIELHDNVTIWTDAEEKKRMEEAFVISSRYEWMFWEMAWNEEKWPV